MGEQLPSDAAAPVLGAHEQILEVDARSAEPRGERREEQGEAGRLARDLGDHRFGSRAIAEERVREHCLGADDALGGALIVGELTHELQ